MKHANNMKGQITIKKYQTKHIQDIKSAIAYTMPRRPEQAMSIMNSQIDLKVSKQIMFIPFPQIRNVIATFMKPYQKTDTGLSQILAAEYQDNEHLQRLDRVISQKICQGYHQQIKLESIERLFLKTKQMKQEVSKLKKQIKDRKAIHIQQRLREIQDQAITERQKVKFNQEKIQEIEKKTNNQIIKQFRDNAKAYEQKNKLYIDLQFAYSEIKQFTKQMQKIVSIVWRYQKIPEVSQQSLKKQNFIEYFLTNINEQKKALNKSIRQLQVGLEFFREDVKQQSDIQQQDGENSLKYHEDQLKIYVQQSEACEANIKVSIYQKLKYIQKLDQYIVPNLQNQIQSTQKDYGRFVQTYTDIKEVNNCSNQLSDFYRIISDEEKHLSDHLRLNSSLIVYFKTSAEFENFNRSLKKRKYIEQIFIQRITPIMNAIQFNNVEYSQMYEKACKDKKSFSGLSKSMVAQKEKALTKNLQTLEKRFKDPKKQNNHFQYVTHLIIALGRLMALCKE